MEADNKPVAIDPAYLKRILGGMVKTESDKRYFANKNARNKKANKLARKKRRINRRRGK
jgi:hypothetical protein